MYPMHASGEDPEALLVNWLNEIIYLLDGKRHGKRVAVARIEVTALSPQATAKFPYDPHKPKRSATADRKPAASPNLKNTVGMP